MKRVLLACMGALGLAAPAQAINVTIIADVTLTIYPYDPSLPPWETPPITYGPKLSAYHLVEDESTGLFSVDNAYLLGNPCLLLGTSACLMPTFAGNTVQFNAPAMDPYSYGFSLTFDREIESFGDMGGAHLVSGYYGWSEITTVGGFAEYGPVIAAFVPEPATWAMLIAGFALAGGAIRRRTSASFA